MAGALGSGLGAGYCKRVRAGTVVGALGCSARPSASWWTRRASSAARSLRGGGAARRASTGVARPTLRRRLWHRLLVGGGALRWVGRLRGRRRRVTDESHRAVVPFVEQEGEQRGQVARVRPRRCDGARGGRGADDEAWPLGRGHQRRASRL